MTKQNNQHYYFADLTLFFDKLVSMIKMGSIKESKFIYSMFTHQMKTRFRQYVKNMYGSKTKLLDKLK